MGIGVRYEYNLNLKLIKLYEEMIELLKSEDNPNKEEIQMYEKSLYDTKQDNEIKYSYLEAK